MLLFWVATTLAVGLSGTAVVSFANRLIETYGFSQGAAASRTALKRGKMGNESLWCKKS